MVNLDQLMVVQTKLYLLKSKVSALTSESKVLIHEYVNFFPAVGINNSHLIFYDVQTTFYKKVKFWSGKTFGNWHIINVFIWCPLFSYFSVSW